MSVRSAIRRADVLSRGPVSSEALSADAVYSQPGGAAPERRVQSGEQFDDQAGLVPVQRMQGVGELAVVGREILQHEHEAARQRVERRPVRLGQAGQFRRQLAVEPRLGLGEPAQFTHQAGRGGFGGHLDEDRSRNTVTGERQPGSRRRARVAADHRHRRDGAPHDLRQGRGVEIADRCGAGIERGRRRRRWRYVVHRARDATARPTDSAQRDSPRHVYKISRDL